MSTNPFDIIDHRLTEIELSIKKLAEKQQEPETKKSETYLTGQQVCEMLSISRVTLYNWNKKGIIHSVRLGNLRRYRLSDIEKIGASE